MSSRFGRAITYLTKTSDMAAIDSGVTGRGRKREDACTTVTATVQFESGDWFVEASAEGLPTIEEAKGRISQMLLAFTDSDIWLRCPGHPDKMLSREDDYWGFWQKGMSRKSNDDFEDAQLSIATFLDQCPSAETFYPAWFSVLEWEVNEAGKRTKRLIAYESVTTCIPAICAQR